MSLTDRLTRPTTALLFGVAALLPAIPLPTAPVAAAAEIEPVECEEWSIDDEGKYVCGPVEEECPPVVAHCDEVTECLDPEGCEEPEPDPKDPDPEDPDPEPPSDPGPARPVVVQPPFTG